MHPDQLVEIELIESKCFLPQKERLTKNKDKDPEFQTAHIQAGTIKRKLTNSNHFCS